MRFEVLHHVAVHTHHDLELDRRLLTIGHWDELLLVTIIDEEKALQSLRIILIAEAGPVFDTFDHALVQPDNNLLLVIGHYLTLESVFVQSVSQLLARDQVLNFLLKIDLLIREPKL